jgi:hypothetical protein
MQDGTSVPVPALSPAEEQERWLHDAFKAVKQHAFYMKRALVRDLLAGCPGRCQREGPAGPCLSQGVLRRQLAAWVDVSLLRRARHFARRGGVLTATLCPGPRLCRTRTI